MFTDADLMRVYTRREALNDGAIIDASSAAREAGFRVPVALTAKAWAACVGWSPDEATPRDHGGGLWDVLGDGSARRPGRGPSGRLRASRIRRAGDTTGQSPHAFGAAGPPHRPSDQGECVATILASDED